jgi:hypothetical protein
MRDASRHDRWSVLQRNEQLPTGAPTRFARGSIADLDAGSPADEVETATEPLCTQCGERLSFARPPMLCVDCAVEDFPHTD